MDTVRAAFVYAERGWAVVPLHSPKNGSCSCSERGRGQDEVIQRKDRTWRIKF